MDLPTQARVGDRLLLMSGLATMLSHGMDLPLCPVWPAPADVRDGDLYGRRRSGDGLTQ